MTLPRDSRLFALVPGAGVGARMNAPLPKQYLTLQGRTLAEHTLGRLLALPRIEQVMVAIAEDDPWWPALPVASRPRVATVTGGESRAHSVLNGLDALLEKATADDWVLVHDMARPCVRPSDIERLIDSSDASGAILALPVSDTLKRAEDQRISATVPRESIWRALTPQLFPIGALRDAIAKALADNVTVTDEASAMEYIGWQPLLVQGQADNIKVTLAEDLALADFFLQRQKGLTSDV